MLLAPAGGRVGDGTPWRREATVLMHDQLNVPLEDGELLDEVELTTNLIIAASAAPEPLTQEVVDRILGLDGEDVEEPGPIPRQPFRLA